VLCALCIQVLDAFAAKRRAVREAAGALELESAEFRFETSGDDEGAPTAMALKADIPMMKVRSLALIFRSSSNMDPEHVVVQAGHLASQSQALERVVRHLKPSA